MYPFDSLLTFSCKYICTLISWDYLPDFFRAMLVGTLSLV